MCLKHGERGIDLLKLKNKAVVLLVLIISFGAFASGCSLIEKSQEAINKQKVAKVGGEYITRGELDKEFAPVIEQFKAQYGENYLTSDDGKSMVESQKTEYLNMMVENRLLAQKAKELNLFKDENEINEEVKKNIDDLLKQYSMTEEDFNKQLEEAKMTREDFEKSIKEQYVIPKKVYDYVVKDITVGDDEMQKYYDENKATLTESPNKMEVSHIVVNTEEEAKEIKTRLDNGEDFAALAKEKSTEPAAKETGGSLGEVLYNDPNYDPTFVKAAMELKEGQISDPVSTQFGYHIIKVTKKTEYPQLTFEQAKDKIKDQLLSEKKDTKYSDTLKEWKDKAGIKIYEDKINNMK